MHLWLITATLLVLELCLSSGSLHVRDWTRGRSTFSRYSAANPPQGSVRQKHGTASAAARAMAFATPGGDYAGEGEFVGPFPSWTDVKQSYGAAGNGTIDDTAAIQKGLNALGTGSVNVLYFPAGTYKITKTLMMPAKINVAMVGEDPSNTIIKWYGSPGADMLYLNGTRYSRWQRITWDGSGVAGAAINHGWDGHTANGATCLEHVDEVFKDLNYGIRAGTVANSSGIKGWMDAEGSIVRAQFYRCSQACVSIESGNALDWWVRDSLFVDNRLGVTNEYGNGGNYHVLGSVFRNSSYADVSVRATHVFSLRGNTSLGSRKFLIAKDVGRNGSNHTLQANNIITTQDPVSIDFGNLGPLIMIDNKIQSKPGVSGPVVVQSNTSPGGQNMSIGNTWTVEHPIAATGPAPRSWALDDVVDSSLRLTVPTLPATPPNNHRTILEVAPGSDSVAIQNTIYQASAAGNNAVVHLAAGNYNIANSLIIPGNASIQIVGDSRATTLVWSGSAGIPVLILRSPSRAILRDFTINASASANGIEIQGADQAGARVFTHEVWASGTRFNSLVADGLDYTDVHMQDFLDYFYGTTASAVAVVVKGGGNKGGRVLLDGGAELGQVPTPAGMYDVTDGGQLVIQDRWYEGTSPTVWNFTGRDARFTISGCTITPYESTPGPTAIFNGFTGTAAVVNVITQKHWLVTQVPPDARIVMLGISAIDSQFLQASGPPGPIALFGSLERVGGWTPIQDIGTPDPAVIRPALAQLRAELPGGKSPVENRSAVIGRKRPPRENAASMTTNVQMFRLGLQYAVIGIRITH